eukprot:GGOE01003082.1.p1 GENE.GGOE01003082.1~~GGOE01003082.1.p1  ORF type:complete len:769 (-),score=156.86 GGOE01003082.1:255-2561(-)
MPLVSPVPAIAAPFRRWADAPQVMLANFPQDQASAMLRPERGSGAADPPLSISLERDVGGPRSDVEAEVQQSVVVLHKLLHHVMACPSLRPVVARPPTPILYPFGLGWPWPAGSHTDATGAFASPMDFLFRQAYAEQEQQWCREKEALRQDFQAALELVRRAEALPREAEADRARLWDEFLQELQMLGQWEAEVRRLLLERVPSPLRLLLPLPAVPEGCIAETDVASSELQQHLTVSGPSPREHPRPQNGIKSTTRKSRTKVHPSPGPVPTAPQAPEVKNYDAKSSRKKERGRPAKGKRDSQPPRPVPLKPSKPEAADVRSPKRTAPKPRETSPVGTPTAMLLTEATGSAALMAPETVLPSARDRDFLATTLTATSATAVDPQQAAENMSHTVSGEKLVQASMDLNRLYCGVCHAPSNGVSHIGRLMETDFSPTCVTTYTLKLPDKVAQAFPAADNVPFHCQEICPTVFVSLRALHGVTAEEYAAAWPEPDEPIEAHPSVGRSGAHFLHSRDGRFLFKIIPSSESATLVGEECRFLKEYHGHLQVYPTSLLQRLFGLFRFRLPSGTVWGIVMGNLYHHPGPEQVQQRFDLKGRRPKTRKAHVDQHSGVSGHSHVIKDNALERQFALPGATRDLLLQALRADLTFLADHGVMDYSLLVGVIPRSARCANLPAEGPPGPLGLQVARPGSAAVWVAGGTRQHPENYTLGIADCLTRYSVKKVAAHFFKAFLWDDEELSTVKPPYYAARLERFVAKVFVSSDEGPPHNPDPS